MTGSPDVPILTEAFNMIFKRLYEHGITARIIVNDIEPFVDTIMTIELRKGNYCHKAVITYDDLINTYYDTIGRSLDRGIEKIEKMYNSLEETNKNE